MKTNSHKQYYTDMIGMIKEIIKENTDPFLTILEMQQEFSKVKQNPLFTNSALKYKTMALEHAADILTTLENRFLGELRERNHA